MTQKLKGDATANDGESKKVEPSETPAPLEMSPSEGYAAARRAEKKGRKDVAEKLYRKIIAASPGHGKSMHALALLALKSDRKEEGLKLLRRAAALLPELPLIHRHMSMVLENDGMHYEAEMAARRAISLEPAAWKHQLQLGKVLMRQERYEEACRTLDPLVEDHPSNHRLLGLLGAAHHKLSEISLAENFYRRALQARPDDSEILLNYGGLLVEQDRPDEAGQVLGKVSLAEPENQNVLVKRGRAKVTGGELDDAIALFRQCLDINPMNIDALFHLSRVHRFQEKDPLLANLEHLVDRLQDSPDKQSMALTALGRASHQLGKYDEAFHYFQEANRVRTIPEFDVDLHRAQAVEVTKLFDAAMLSQTNPAGASERTPIFVLGTPRSGKSLVERLLKRHDHVFGGGESKEFIFAVKRTLNEADIEENYPQFVKQIDLSHIEQIARRYLEASADLGPGQRFFVNTIPGHDRYVGLLTMTYPKAPIVYVERDAMDVCFQMYAKRFASGNPYTLDLGHLGAFYAQHQFVMRHWMRSLGSRILHVSYEHLVTDTERAWKSIEAYCGLTKAELEPERFSTEYVGISKPYLEHLSPLAEAINNETMRLGGQPSR